MSDEGDKPQTIIGDIEFNNVIFTYPARQEAPVCFSGFFHRIL
jgi:ABC-type multidrug transport system fused ATPase/permease subunit